MNREQMLEKMGLSDEEFRGYLTKSKAFVDSLSPAQLKFHLDSKGPGMSVDKAAAAFGPEVTADHINDLFAEAPPVHGVLFTNSCCCGKA
jgi:hypothetical protein